jgi:hypothetical protein
MIDIAREFYAEWPDTRQAPPLLVQAFVTAENVEQLVSDNGFAGEVDLLSIDLDGIDYWVWKALDCVRPRVAIMEYQSFLGPERAITVPYRPDFTKTDYRERRVSELPGVLAGGAAEPGKREGVSIGRLQSVRLQRVLRPARSGRRLSARGVSRGLSPAPAAGQGGGTMGECAKHGLG